MPKSKRGGRRLNPQDIDQAMASVNPRFSWGKEYQENCQRVVYAYEMARRGYHVNAKPREDLDKSKEPMFKLKDGVPLWMQVFEGQKWTYMRLRGNTPPKVAMEEIEDYATRFWGAGARGVVFFARKSGTAHVLNIEISADNKVQYIDAQTGKRPDMTASNYFGGDCRTETIEISRIDNLKPTKLIDKCQTRYSRKSGKESGNGTHKKKT